MPNREHLDILKQGAARWNKWREDNPDVQPELRGANLAGANLAGTNLAGADLTRANLAGADLSGADLPGVRLTAVNFRGTILREADFEQAIIWETVFADTDLTGATGLDRCDHQGPSIIDHRTLTRNPHLPIAFLRGCGLTDWQIESAKLLSPNLTAAQVTDIGYKIIELRSDPAIQFHSCFISYSSKDDAFARKLHHDLQEAGVRCWFAQEDLKIGDKFRDVIDRAVRLHDKLLLILSTASVKSDWVEDEVEAALEKERKRKETALFPIRIDDALLNTRRAWASKLRRQRHIGDFTDEARYTESFQRLLRDLREWKTR